MSVNSLSNLAAKKVLAQIDELVQIPILHSTDPIYTRRIGHISPLKQAAALEYIMSLSDEWPLSDDPPERISPDVLTQLGLIIETEEGRAPGTLLDQILRYLRHEDTVKMFAAVTIQNLARNIERGYRYGKNPFTEGEGGVGYMFLRLADSQSQNGWFFDPYDQYGRVPAEPARNNAQPTGFSGLTAISSEDDHPCWQKGYLPSGWVEIPFDGVDFSSPPTYWEDESDNEVFYFPGRLFPEGDYGNVQDTSGNDLMEQKEQEVIQKCLTFFLKKLSPEAGIEWLIDPFSDPWSFGRRYTQQQQASMTKPFNNQKIQKFLSRRSNESRMGILRRSYFSFPYGYAMVRGRSNDGRERYAPTQQEMMQLV